MKLKQINESINSIGVVAMLAALASGFIVLFFGWFPFGQSPVGESTTISVESSDGAKAQKIEVRLIGLYRVSGTKNYYSQLTEDVHRSSYSRSWSPSRNILFFIGEESKQHWLFPKHGSLITDVTQLPQGQSSVEKDSKEKTTAILYRFIKGDTDGDGELTDDDLQAIALTDANGENFTVLEPSVRTIIAQEVSNDGEIVAFLVEREDRSVFLSKYSWATLSKLSEQEVTNISQPF